MGEAGASAIGALVEKQPAALSFKQIVANESTQNQQATAEELDLVSDDEAEPDDDVDPTCPVIRLTKEEKIRLRSKWKQTLIVKVMGRSVGYGYLQRRLMTLWRPKAKMEVVSVDNGYFLVKFASVDDYEFAKFGGPWMVLDHYLIVKEWMPNFDPFTDKTESMIVWIRFPCLPAEYYDHKFLMRVGAKIGRPINIDTATSLVSRASFARVCVEVDITKPLLAKFTLRNRVRPIVYEGIHLICFSCGTYGHTTEGCRLNHGEDATQTQENGGEQRPATNSGTVNGQISDAHGNTSPHMETTIIRPELTADYGSWMVAPKQKRNYARNQGNRNQGGKENGKRNQQETNKGKNINAQSGSRYASLGDTNASEEEQFEEALAGEQLENQSRTQGITQTGKAKGKRPATQVSEKQIMGNNQHGKHKRQPEIGESSARRNRSNQAQVAQRNQAQVAQRNQAGAASEHTLVMGDKNGSKSIQVLETENDNGPECMEGTTLFQEHFGDPPDDEQREEQLQEEQLGDSVSLEALDDAAMEVEL